MVGFYINTMKMTFRLKFLIFNNLFKLQVKKHVSFSLFPCSCALMLFESLVEIKIESGSRLHCIDIYDDDCTKSTQDIKASVSLLDMKSIHNS